MALDSKRPGFAGWSGLGRERVGFEARPNVLNYGLDYQNIQYGTQHIGGSQ